VFQPVYQHNPVQTGVSPEVLDKCVRGLTKVPATFKLNPKIKRLLEGRAQAHKEGGPVDWGFGEALAFGSLLVEGTPVRLSGQDCERGTFSHRHAVFHDANTGEQLVSLQEFPQSRAAFELHNSPLSENATVGFEFGYNIEAPERLVIWEAQYGDFINGAQIMLDQFVISGRAKWGLTPSMVFLLPHGYEGQGPEHSSARPERFMQQSADDNLQICNLTTSAQIFHVLRRQVLRPWRKPLVIMTPKSLLRHRDAASDLVDLARGEFRTVIPDASLTDPQKVRRAVLCSGKVYYDLNAERNERKADDVALIRIEQLYPFPHKALTAEFKRLPNMTEVLWCQDEPQNMGSWFYVQHHLLEAMSDVQKLSYAGRPASASPAVGYYAKHIEQQKALIDAAFAKLKGLVLHR